MGTNMTASVKQQFTHK
uniref:Uncharacterized protein n=1 Tax=Rhizophora mucronata TaxID=61149 RepID=A0A2P2NX57_RHIMU